MPVLFASAWSRPVTHSLFSTRSPSQRQCHTPLGILRSVAQDNRTLAAEDAGLFASRATYRATNERNGRPGSVATEVSDPSLDSSDRSVPY